MTDLMPYPTNNPILSYTEIFDLAERICKSALIPQAYRGKPADAAIAMMTGQEVGIPAMTSLQQINVINGRPTFAATGMTALIRRAGHSVTGDINNLGATVTGKRLDSGDVMTATFTMADAKAAGLVKPNTPWTKYTEDMLWSRAVSRLGRRLFPDVLLGLQYVPEEMETVVQEQKDTTIVGLTTPVIADEPVPAIATVREPPAALQVVEDTGEIIDRPGAQQPYPQPVPEDADAMMHELAEIVKSAGDSVGLKGQLIAKFGPASKMPPERIQEAIDFAAGWPYEVEEPLPLDDASF